MYSAPVEVELATLLPDWPIYYTTDGTEPTPETGTLYSGPIVIQGQPDQSVVTVRATAFPDGRIPTRTATYSYVFPEFAINQPAAPDGFPATWGVTQTRSGDYEMDPDVLGDPAAAAAAVTALSSLPTLSITMDPDDLFGTTGGIYMFPDQEGVEWERPASAEMVFGDGTSVQADCGIRIQGGSSTRNWKSAKLSMRLLFKTIYGQPKLEFPVFGPNAEDRFDTLVLDAHLNLAWTHPDHGQRIRSQYIRDLYVSDLANAIGSTAPHGRFFHLFLNGLYWGVYDVHERPDASFAAHYLGGNKEEYDVFKHDRARIIQGDTVAWDAMFQIARGDLTDPANYLAIQQYLDVADLADYMLVNFYVGNDDWPHHNWYAARHRSVGAQFRFFSWDAEHVLKSVAIDRTGVGNTETPAELYQRLLANDEFRALVAARAAELFGTGGVLAPESAAVLYDLRANEVRDAMLLESARWGDNRRPAQPYTQADWLAEYRFLIDEYFPQRTAQLQSQLSGL